jgi:hypothetical protein
VVGQVVLGHVFLSVLRFSVNLIFLNLVWFYFGIIISFCCSVSRMNLCKICGGQGGIGPRFSFSTSVSVCQYHPTSATYTSSSTFCFYHKDKWAKLCCSVVNCAVYCYCVVLSLIVLFCCYCVVLSLIVLLYCYCVVLLLFVLFCYYYYYYYLCSIYCLCVNVYCNTATGCLPNCRWQIYHIMSYHIISYHIISYHIISYHIISYHIISYHIIYFPSVDPYRITKSIWIWK